MPLWKIYHPFDAFTADDKKGIAQALTGIYGRVMPKFYVGVVFQEVTEDNFYIGGEPHPRFIRIWVDHIARTFQSDEMRVNFFTYVNKLLAPFIADRSEARRVGKAGVSPWRSRW